MTNVTFEKALTDLEQIVAKLEKGGVSLNESLILFEKGVKLARFLRGELDKAEKKVEILLKDGKGGLRPKAFDIDKEGEETETDEDDGETDDPEKEDQGEDESRGGEDDQSGGLF